MTRCRSPFNFIWSLKSEIGVYIVAWIIIMRLRTFMGHPVCCSTMVMFTVFAQYMKNVKVPVCVRVDGKWKKVDIACSKHSR